MTIQKIGPIEILTGRNGSKVPHSTSLLIRGKEQSAVIDCGGGQEVFDYLHKQNVQDIYLTHYHLDHVWGAYLFEDAKKHINPYDIKKLSDPLELAKASGVLALYGENKAYEWIKRADRLKDGKHLSPNWQPIFGIVNNTYELDRPFEIAGENVTFIHTPGHTEGFCCPYFPDHGVLFVGDFDLTSFGPWYNDADSDIEQFFKSAERTLETDAEYFVTAHHKGSFQRKDYEKRLNTFMGKILEREEKTRLAIEKGVPPKDIIYQEIFYLMRNHRQASHFKDAETIGIAKHIQHLIKQGYPYEEYFNDFIAYHNINLKWLNLHSEPIHTHI